MELIELASTFKKFLDAVSDIERLGSLDAVVNEKKAQVARFETERDALYKSLLTRARSETGEQWALEIQAKAQAEADAITANAQRQAANLEAKIKELETRAAQLEVANSATEARLKRAHDAFKATG